MLFCISEYLFNCGNFSMHFFNFTIMKKKAYFKNYASV